jgi:TonB family protein
VLSRSIARGSGNSELDQEVLAMVSRAAPFPPFPA